MSIFDNILNSNEQLHSKESNSLTESEAKTDLIDSKERLYILNKEQTEKGKLNDASATYKELICQKKKVSDWYIDAKFEESDNHLRTHLVTF
ncbi:5382_t:CDS:2 [Cetraspora pellucida]|uniref:5382_t:CDS:1 n=1 Tax=Cetraspora pellucida TaxID=1433469 RepID=A0ACA9K848_9GLOM|nr:5382_t:CDS:2 [Cetraspora pellucida]